MKLEFTFIVSPIEYKKGQLVHLRITLVCLTDDRITDINYYKNRLFFLTKVGTVITTRAGEIDNLFINTAVEVSAD